MYTRNLEKINITILNYLIAFVPFSLIFGNLITNLNVFLICLVGIINFKLKIFQIKKEYIVYLVIIFFFYLIFVTFFQNINFIENNFLYKEHVLKSIFFLRFLFLFLIINHLCKLKALNLKLLFFLWAAASLFVSIDILIQVIFKKNLLGFSITKGRPSGFFGTENIAGPWIQKFSLFFLFSIPLFFKSKINHNFLILLFSIFFLIIITITVNRMSGLIFFISILFIFLIQKKIKEMFLITILSSIIISSVIFAFPLSKLSSSTKSFYIYSKKILINAPELFYYNKIDKEAFDIGAGYLATFNSGAQLWKKNKIFGGGLKSIRLNCKFNDNYACNTHPHNYFLELMVDTGLIGVFLIYTVFILGIINFFKFYLFKNNNNFKIISLPFFLIIFFEFFPIRSTGSFFTTNNAVLIFLILSIFLNLNKIIPKNKI